MKKKIKVYCYKLNDRWCFGPKVGSRSCWMWSKETPEPPYATGLVYTEAQESQTLKTIRRQVVFPTKQG